MDSKIAIRKAALKGLYVPNNSKTKNLLKK